VARRLLDAQGLQGVAIESTSGILSDHYDPHSKTLRLSQQVYFTPSVAAAGIAAHEAGHALQDAEDYFPMEALTYIVPIVQIASQVAPWLFVVGLLLQLETLTWVGVILFGSSFLLAIVTLPVEFNASARAKELLLRYGIIQGDEQIAGVEKVRALECSGARHPLVQVDMAPSHTNRKRSNSLEAASVSLRSPYSRRWPRRRPMAWSQSPDGRNADRSELIEAAAPPCG
jgi:hypothetical protein